MSLSHVYYRFSMVICDEFFNLNIMFKLLSFVINVYKLSWVEMSVSKSHMMCIYIYYLTDTWSDYKNAVQLYDWHCSTVV